MKKLEQTNRVQIEFDMKSDIEDGTMDIEKTLKRILINGADYMCREIENIEVNWIEPKKGE